MHGGGGQGWRLGRRPALDGLRGAAVLMVMVGHAGILRLPSIQNYGVEFFFVLSGFLITALLLEEHEQTGRIALRQFYGRRIRRLLPALVVFMAVLLLAAHTANLFAVGEVHRGIAFGLFYSANIAELMHVRLGVMSPLWSLAVEEHFYAVFPVVLAGLLAVGRRAGRRRVALRLALAVVLVGMTASFVARLALYRNVLHVIVGTDTRCGGLLLGCAIALTMHMGLFEGLRLSSARWNIVAGVAAAMTMLFATTGAMAVIGLIEAAMAAGLIVLAIACSAPQVCRVLGWRPLRCAGELSYAAYLWHCAIFKLLGGTYTLSFPRAIVGIALTFALAYLSMRFVEARFRLRSRSNPPIWTVCEDWRAPCSTSARQSRS